MQKVKGETVWLGPNDDISHIWWRLVPQISPIGAEQIYSICRTGGLLQKAAIIEVEYGYYE
jgi:hypothetical protein